LLEKGSPEPTDEQYAEFRIDALSERMGGA